MKNLYILLVAVLLSSSLMGQSPEKMSYQAIVRNAENTPVANQSVGMQISILQGSAAGASVYVETHAPMTNNQGLVSLSIGEGTVVSGTFTNIDWSAGPYFILTETDPTGGENYTITGTSQLLSVPYALHAKTAENIANDQVDDADADPTNELQNLTLSGTTLNITDGTGVDLNAIIPPGGTDDQTAAEVSVSPSGNLSSSNVQGALEEIQQDVDGITSFTGDFNDLINVPADLADGDDVDDADADPANEIQNLSFDTSNNLLSLTEPGQPDQTADLSSLVTSGSGIYGGSGTLSNDVQIDLGNNDLDVNSQTGGDFNVALRSDESNFSVKTVRPIGSIPILVSALYIEGATGNVGIRTSNISAALDVLGDIEASENIDAGGFISATEDITAGGDIGSTGDIVAGGNVVINEKVVRPNATGSADMIPIAYGNVEGIYHNETYNTVPVSSGTGNFSVSKGFRNWPSFYYVAGEYLITIDDVDYNSTDYVTVVTTRAGGNSQAWVTASAHADGQLMISFIGFDENMDPEYKSNSFYFVVYKPQ